jgi:hypothetical protein
MSTEEVVPDLVERMGPPDGSEEPVVGRPACLVATTFDVDGRTG